MNMTMLIKMMIPMMIGALVITMASNFHSRRDGSPIELVCWRVKVIRLHSASHTVVEKSQEKSTDILDPKYANIDCI